MTRASPGALVLDRSRLNAKINRNLMVFEPAAAAARPGRADERG